MNPLRSPSLMCRIFGCKTFGPYYGMPQAHCWGCGTRTSFAQAGEPEFVEPARVAIRRMETERSARKESAGWVK